MYGHNPPPTQLNQMSDSKPTWFDSAVKPGIHLGNASVRCLFVNLQPQFNCPKQAVLLRFFLSQTEMERVSDSAGTSSPGKVSGCFKHFPLVNNLW